MDLRYILNADDAAASNEAIPVPPLSHIFDTHQEVYEFLQGFHREHGADIFKRSYSDDETFLMAPTYPDSI